MNSWQDILHEAGDFDVRVDSSRIPNTISPTFAAGEAEMLDEAGDDAEYETGAQDSPSDNRFADANTGVLEIVSSEANSRKATSVGENKGIIVPTVGMKFKDEKEVFEFYKKYAYEIGFPVRKRTSKKGDDGLVRYVTFTCSREGSRSSGTNALLKPQPTIQTGCKARLTACSEVNGY